jgi:nucleotide-binding universal stress UspA family protein
MKKFLVAVDGSNAALRALGAAARLAKAVPGASLHLVHCHEAPDIYGEIAVYVPKAKMARLQRAHSEDVLKRAEAKLRGARVRHTREVLTGPVAATIARRAERLKCDAIVMGRHGDTTLGQALMGSVAQKVLHASKLPVLLVR